jgi:ubiquitin carboxyl-terminal hydrolase 9/24
LLKSTYSLLIPSTTFHQIDETKRFQENYILSNAIDLFTKLLLRKKNNSQNKQKTFDKNTNNDDDSMRKASYLYLLKINKLTMTIQCQAIFSFVLNAIQSKKNDLFTEEQHNHAVLLQNSVPSIPSNTNEITIRQVAQRLGQQFCTQLINKLPDINLVIELEKIAWSLAATSTLSLIDTNDFQSSFSETFHEKLIANLSQSWWQSGEVTMYDMQVCREALECLSLSMCLVPNALDTLNQSEKHWRMFIIDLLLICPSRLIRQTAAEQFLLIALKCSLQPNKAILFFIQMLFAYVLQLNNQRSSNNATINYSGSSEEYFHLLCRLLNCAHLNQVKLSNADTLLNNEIQWLKKLKETYLATNEIQENELLLDGHLNLTKELLQFQSSEKKRLLNEQNNLINDLIEHFIFPSSCLFKKLSDSSSFILSSNNNLSIKKPICKYGSSNMQSAFELLIALCTGCLKNFNDLTRLIFELFYPSMLDNNNYTYISNNSEMNNDCTISQNEWEYLPPVGQRPRDGFVGLKNAGATCYMNSVLQQLFMIKEIRNSILNIEIPLPAEDANNKSSTNQMMCLDLSDSELNESSSNFDSSLNNNQSNKELSRKDYNMTIFRCLQMIFGHLSESKMQFYIPKLFWRQFRFGSVHGERVNLREQHDAVEFFNSVVDCIDETMKAMNMEQICAQVLGGTFADQKICKGCPHRYSRDESFTLLSVDIKHSQRLSESLEQYVKGDLLEGPNAYHCEKCNKKIDAVKRTCIKKLPKILAIQLKRFDYDWEREIAVKSNEYFEFPHEIDMQPYTVKGVANLDREQLKQQQKQSKKSYAF